MRHIGSYGQTFPCLRTGIQRVIARSSLKTREHREENALSMPRKIPIYHAEVCHNSIVEFLLATSLVWLALQLIVPRLHLAAETIGATNMHQQRKVTRCSMLNSSSSAQTATWEMRSTATGASCYYTESCDHKREADARVTKLQPNFPYCIRLDA